MNLKKLKITSFIFGCICLFVSNANAQNLYNQKHIEVSLRMIGHQVLLNSGDSLSRVMPIITNNNQYKIQFENEFKFEPEELILTINRVVKETKIANHYIVEVEKCITREIIHSYEIDDIESSSIVPCQYRIQPKSCYNILFTLVEAGGTKVELNTATLNSSKFNWINYIAIATMFMLVVLASFFVWKKRNKPVIDLNLITIGQFHFDQKHNVLSLESQRIELTNKEADLLLLLHQNANVTIEREVLLNTVWGDNGDYVGRTLDVFISKLRKKLKVDSTVKIVNIRGVGYKLVIDN